MNKRRKTISKVDILDLPKINEENKIHIISEKINTRSEESLPLCGANEINSDIG